MGKEGFRDGDQGGKVPTLGSSIGQRRLARRIPRAGRSFLVSRPNVEHILYLYLFHQHSVTLRERPEAIERCADVRGPINASKSIRLAQKLRGSGKN